MAGINDVNMNILVMEISTINNLKMTYTMRIKLTMEWNDPRIETEAFPVTGPKNRIVPGNSVGTAV